MIVYSAIFGGYDDLKPHPSCDLVDEWICYTDNPDVRCDGWQTIVEPQPFTHPRMAAKWRKCHPPTHDDLTIWVDGSMSFRNGDFFEMVAGLLDQGDWVMFPHPDRTSIVDEEAVSDRKSVV